MQKKNKQPSTINTTRISIKIIPGQKLVRNLSLAVRRVGLLIILALLLILTTSKIVPVSATPGSEILWAKSQVCDFILINPEYSLDGATQGMDSTVATCTWGASSNDTAWTFTEFTHTSFDVVNDFQLAITFAVADWQAANKLSIQVSNNGGIDWTTLDDFNSNNPAPIENTTITYDINHVLHSLVELQAVQVRLMVPALSKPPPSFIIALDSIAITVSGEYLPTLTSTQAVTIPVIPIETLESTPTTIPAITLTATPIPPLPIGVTSIVSNTVPATTSPTITLAPTLMPSSTVTPFPAVTLKINDGNQTQELWGVEQSCDFVINNPTSSLDQAFNDQIASCSGKFAMGQDAWQFNSFQQTVFTHIIDAIIEVRFSVTGWVDDSFSLEFFDGSQWQVLERFGSGKSIPPGNLLTLGYHVDKYLASPEQVNQAALRLIGDSVNNDPDNLSIAIDEARLSVAGGTAGQVLFEPMPVASFSPMALLDAITAGSPHGDQSMLTDSCSACHYSHSASGSQLRGSWPEEVVCFSCHGGNGPAINVQPSFVNFINTTTRFFSHDVMQTNNIHHLGENNGGDFGGGNRHVECEDCHDPHYAAGGSVLAPNLPPQLSGISGVSPQWVGTGAPSSFSWLTEAAGEYQVCFKCHSSFTSLPTYQPDGWNGNTFVANGLRKLTSTLAGQVLDSRDMAKEFNPAQASFHPVVAVGRNQSISPNTFVNGWSQSSMVFCTDCHSNPGATAGDMGTHGSPQLHLLNGTANYSTVPTNGATVSSGQVCFQCHNYQTYVTDQEQSTHFRPHAKHMNISRGVTCYTCHDSHGSEQQHLINFDASIVTFLNGKNSQTAWYYDPVTKKGGCFLSCHNVTHNPKDYDP